MIKIIQDLPAGTVGLDAVGKVTEDDYRDVLVPAVSTALDRDDVRPQLLRATIATVI